MTKFICKAPKKEILEIPQPELEPQFLPFKTIDDPKYIVSKIDNPDFFDNDDNLKLRENKKIPFEEDIRKEESLSCNWVKKDKKIDVK